MSDNIQAMIDKYSQELLALSKRSPGAAQSAPQAAQTPAEPTAQEDIIAAQREAAVRDAEAREQAAQQAAEAAAQAKAAEAAAQAKAAEAAAQAKAAEAAAESKAAQQAAEAAAQAKAAQQAAEAAAQAKAAQQAAEAAAQAKAAQQAAEAAAQAKAAQQAAEAAAEAKAAQQAAEAILREDGQEYEDMLEAVRAQLQVPQNTQEPASKEDLQRASQLVVPLRGEQDSANQAHVQPTIVGETPQGIGRGEHPFVPAQSGVLGISTENLLVLQQANAQQNEFHIQQYLDAGTKTGTLKVQVFASDSVYPIRNARVVVYKTVDGENYVIYDKLTDINGVVEGMVLPAPSKDNSMHPVDGSVPVQDMPYFDFSIYVEHPGFLRVIYPDVTIFEGVESIKPVTLVPKSVGMQDLPPIDFYARLPQTQQ